MKKTIVLLLVILSNLAYGQVSNKISKEEKVYGLSKFWQEANYNFVYMDRVNREDFDKMYRSLILKVQETENDYEYYRLLQRFCAFLKDGHTNVWFPREIQDNVLTTDFGDYNVFLSNIEGRAIITRINQSKKDELPIGTEILKVNGVETKKYIEENVLPYISSSTDFIRLNQGVERMLEGYVGTAYDLEVRLPNGKIRPLKLTHAKSKEKEVFPDLNKELFEFKWIDKNIAYVALNSFSDWEVSMRFREKAPELLKAKKLIIDLRSNGGGSTNIGKEIFKHLTNDTILYGSKAQSRLHIPVFKAWGKFTTEQDAAGSAWERQAYLTYRDEYYYDFPYSPDTTSANDIALLKTSRIVVPTAILIGNNTASAAEDFLIYADKQKHITRIGEPTYGSTGQPMYLDLPNGGTGRICTKKDTYPDGREFVGYGIQPDITVRKSLADYMENKDPVLKAAIEFLKKKN
ncbi:peptidase S41 [Pontibacter diazotrophicus]|uniref:Peptidase S41 n=1 Tax=Pontibacter diazotrophicus TaxID=1400979 RepID=A0A3D8L004_9BACT|nr:S41 family peptidase [Pontibacter diazotrophicus]RDV10710.1 peptidase S41 [Pontibacter diazotrophicus]